MRSHARRYPLMEPTDAVKLIYQNEFGGGHLIRDEEAVRAYLRREYGQTPKSPALPRYESIGNGLVRVNLAALEETELEALADDFIRSAADHPGSLPSFLVKLEVLKQLTREGIFGFDADALNQYLNAYTQAGFPIVSHSPAYRTAYHPAYRVIRAKE